MPQVVVENYGFEDVFPMNSISGKSNPDIEFNILGSNTEYLDLNDTLLSVTVKVIGEDGKDLATDSEVTPCNYWFHTLFKDIILSLNNEVIEGGNNIYSTKAVIETILNYGTDTKETYLTSIGYSSNENMRSKWISSPFSMCGSLQLDFFDQPKYLIPGVNVHLRLKRNDTSFCLKSNKSSPKLIITEAKLHVRRVKVDPSVLIGHQIGLNTQNAHYPIRKSQLVTYAVSKGSMNFYKDQLFSDERLPKFILVAFQTGDQKNGDFRSFSSTFQNFNVTSISLSRNSDYRETYNQDFENNNYMSSYVQSVIRNMGHLDKNINCGISYSDFKDNTPFFTFVLAPDFDTYSTQLPRQGNLKLNIKFQRALEQPACIHVYGIFDTEIQINKNRTVFY